MPKDDLKPWSYKFAKATAVAIAGLTALPGCQSGGEVESTLLPSGTIEIEQTQVALFLSRSAGSGMLHYEGKTYPFSIGGLGSGGIGVSMLNTTGTVYNLTNLGQLAGTYGQAHWAVAAGDAGEGNLWLEKTDGSVVIHVARVREGLALSFGGDLVDISLD